MRSLIDPVRAEIPGPRGGLPIAELYLGGIPRGGVALLCEGEDPALDASEIMNGLAEHGYESVAAVAPCPPGTVPAPGCDLVRDVIALINHLGKRGWKPGQTGVLGYGSGGSVAFCVAAQGSFGAAVSVTASPAAHALTEMAERAATVRTPWLGLIGGTDDGQLGSAARDLGAALAGRSPVYTEVVTYRAAVASPYRHAPDSAAHAAAFDAWQRTTEWLNLRVAPRLTPLAEAWRAGRSERAAP